MQEQGRRSRRRAAAVSSALAVAVVVAGVAVAASTAGRGGDHARPAAAPSWSPSPVATAVSRAVACPVMAPVHLPPDQDTVTDAFVCGEETRSVPGQGEWTFLEVHRVTSGLDRLLATYVEPDDTRPLPAGVGCTADLQDPRVVYLHSARGVRAVRAPEDQCGHPTAAGVSAFSALGLTLVWEKRDTQTQSQRSIDSGCSDAYKDTLFEDARYGGNAPSHQVHPRPLPEAVTVCRYRDLVDAQGDRVGHLTGSGTLSGQQRDAVDRALAGATVDPTCSREAQRAFALLVGPAPENATTVVALDGCAVSQGDGWWRAGDDLRAALR